MVKVFEIHRHLLGRKANKAQREMFYRTAFLSFIPFLSCKIVWTSECSGEASGVSLPNEALSLSVLLIR